MTPYRIELQGEGRILNANGNPIDGNEKEKLVRMGNCHFDLLSAVEVAEATIKRLERHAPGSAIGTLDVIRAAITKATT